MLSTTISPMRSGEWLHRPILPAWIAKEIRTVAPHWTLACLLPLLVLGLEGKGGPDMQEPANMIMGGFFACFVALLGANAFGVEFTCRTFPLLLSQPVSRRQIWTEKMAILGVALVLGASTVLWSTNSIRVFFEMETVEPLNFFQQLRTELSPQSIFVVFICSAAVNAFCLGPWLSLLARNALAGAVFSLALPLGGVSAVAMLGGDSTAHYLLVLGAGWAMALVLGYQTFIKMEMLETQSEVRLPDWLTRRLSIRAFSAGRRKSGWLQLLIKEVRLQQTTILLALVACAIGGALAAAGRMEVPTHLPSFDAYWFVYCGAISLLAGAVTCADERQLATLEWQLTLPARAATQWAMKCLVALGLALLLGAGLPMLFLKLPGFYFPRPELFEWQNFAITSTVLTVSGMYASSVCGSTVRAFALGLVLPMFVTGLSWKSVGLPTSISMLAAVLWMAYSNYRRTDRPWVRLAWHAVFGGLLLLWLYLGSET